MENFDSNDSRGNGIKKLGKVLIYIIVMAVVFIGGGAFYKYVFEGQPPKRAANAGLAQVTVEVTPEVVAITPIPTQVPTPKINFSPTPSPAATAKPKLSQRQRVLEEMHKMINSKVVADFVWGEVPITEEGVDKLITEVSATTFPDRDKLLTILENWKLNDFTNAVNDHNYIWEQLGGSIGKATALRKQ